MLRELDADSLDAMLACVRWRQLADGETLFREGDPGDTMVFLTAGELAVSVRRAEGGTVRVGASVIGDTLGEMACIDPAPRSATVTATMPSVVAELSRDTLGALESAVPMLAARLTGEVIQVITRRMRELEARIDQELGVTPAPPPSRPAPPMASDEPRRGGLLGLLDRLRGVA
ncbi:MAG: cyclic nucleotide-binding domain-containing protein [Polyangiales bacterium]